MTADPMIPMPFRVVRQRHELRNVVTLTLEPEAGGRFSFQPGQFNMLYHFGMGEVPISVSGDPAKRRLRHTIRSVGAVTHALTRLRKGDGVGVRGPFGAPWPLAEAEGRDVVLAAGGLGMAPLRPVLYAVMARRERYGRVTLYYGARSPADILYRKQLERWGKRRGIDVRITVDKATPAWRGHVGVVTRLMSREHFAAGNTIAMLCGPEVMMRFSAQTLNRLGVSDGRIYLSMERNMQCGIGLCGHCQLGPTFICRDGPVYRLDEVLPLMKVRGL